MSMGKKYHSHIFFLIFLVSFFSCKKEKVETIDLNPPKITIEKIIDNYEIIWGMDFMPNGDLVVSRSSIIK